LLLPFALPLRTRSRAETAQEFQKIFRFDLFGENVAISLYFSTLILRRQTVVTSGIAQSTCSAASRLVRFLIDQYAEAAEIGHAHSSGAECCGRFIAACR
jgi:hypothetical protein